MEQSSFRSAFHGFNREDVVQYLEYINNKHQQQVNQLNARIQELEEAQNTLPEEQAEAEELRMQLEQKDQELEDLRNRCCELEEKLSAADDAAALTRFQQAEQMERSAKAHADLTYYQVNGILSTATAQVDTAAQELTQAAANVMEQLTRLQMAVGKSKDAIQDASGLMHAIRPDQN